MTAPVDSPRTLSDIIGASDDSAADWRPQVMTATPGKGVIPVGGVVALVSGKVLLVDATSYASVIGIALERLDTGTDAASTDTFTVPVARAGSFYAPALFVASGADLNQCATRLRELNVSLEGLSKWTYVAPTEVA